MPVLGLSGLTSRSPLRPRPSAPGSRSSRTPTAAPSSCRATRARGWKREGCGARGRLDIPALVARAWRPRAGGLHFPAGAGPCAPRRAPAGPAEGSRAVAAWARPDLLGGAGDVPPALGISSRTKAGSGAAGLRPLPGAGGVACAELGPAAARPPAPRRGGPQPRPHRSLRLPARPARRLHRARLLHAGQSISAGDAARRRPPAGRGSRLRQSPSDVQARPGAAALHPRGRRHRRARAGPPRGVRRDPFAAPRPASRRASPTPGISWAPGSSRCPRGWSRRRALGRYRPLRRAGPLDPEPLAEADALLLESTYGDRLHPDDDRPSAWAR